MLPRQSVKVVLLLTALLALPSTTFASLVGADLSITKTDGAASSTPGTGITYTITASNAGPADVTGATVSDTFPAALTGCSWTCSASAGSSCTAAGMGNISDSANLLNGGTATYTATCTIDAAATGSLVNTATISSMVTDPTPGNNSATDTNTLTPSADLSVTKSDGAASSTPGTGITYTITATNSGPSDVTGATVADTFPAALTGCSWTCSASAGSSCTAAGMGNISDSANLLSGGTATYTATCTVDAAATGSLVNTATISSMVTDPTPGNNSATDTNTLTPSADLSIAAVVTPSPVAVGQPFTIDVTVTNNGPSVATGVMVASVLPANTTFNSTTGCTEDPSGVPTCSLGTIAVGAMASFTINAMVDAAGSDPATLSVSSDASDPTPGNDTAAPVINAQSVLEIPTTTQLGQLLLLLLLVGAALWVLRR